MNYEDWLASIEDRIKSSPLWRMPAYQKSMFLNTLVWDDCELFEADERGEWVAKQLLSSTGAIGASLARGFGYGSRRETLAALRVSLGSVQEARCWYENSRGLLAPEVLDQRLELLDEIAGLLQGEIVARKKRPPSS